MSLHSGKQENSKNNNLAAETGLKIARKKTIINE